MIHEKQQRHSYMAASAIAKVGTWVGFVQPGSLSFVQVELARATRTRLARSTSVWVLVAMCVLSMCAVRLTWWCMWPCWCRLCMVLRPVSHPVPNGSY
jgi:hypothetical protein